MFVDNSSCPRNCFFFALFFFPFSVSSFFLLSFFFRSFRHRTLVQEYENTISNLETKSAQQTREIEELRQQAEQRIVNAKVTEVPPVAVNHRSANISSDTDNISLKNRIDELLSIQRDKRKKYELAEQSIAELESRCEHYECYIQVSRSRKTLRQCVSVVSEKNQIVSLRRSS